MTTNERDRVSAVNFVVIDIGLESFPPLLFAALRFGLIAFHASAW